MMKREDVNRILWGGRRGLLELDLLFETFILSKYSFISESAKSDFQNLLDCDDDQLFSWFFGSEEIPSEFVSIVSLVNEHYREEKKGS